MRLPIYIFRLAAISSICSVLGTTSHGQNRIGTGAADQLYQEYCASCHGEDLRGGSASSLVDGEWIYGSSDDEIAKVIREGLPDDAMPSYGEAFTAQEIRSLVIYLREGRQIAENEEATADSRPEKDVFRTEEASFRLEAVAEGPGTFWGLAFLPDGDALVTEKSGKLWELRDGKLEGPVEGIPEVNDRGQGGLLDVAPHPDYEDNGWIYLSYSHSRDGEQMTRFVRGRIEEGRWIDEEVIWEAPAETYLTTHHHYGSRFAFRDGYVFFSIGDRGRQDLAQDLSLPNGNIFRLHDDGRIPQDNPFVDRENALPAIWSYGHRNPQGLARHPETDEIWSTEHGPRGGDEVNLIERGINYGWPEITYGMNYNGTPITDKTHAPGMAQPKLHWTPSIAACGIEFYIGDAIPAWKNNLFATGLASQELHRLVIEDGEVVKDEIVLEDEGRLRDVANGPGGYLYLAIEHDRDRSGIYRLVPTEEEKD